MQSRDSKSAATAVKMLQSPKQAQAVPQLHAPCAAAQAVLTKEHCIIYRRCLPTECFKGCNLGVFE